MNFNNLTVGTLNSSVTNKHAAEIVVSHWEPGKSAFKMKLSKRNLEVVHLAKSGKTNEQIAKQLGLTTKTIKTYREDLLKVTKTNNVAELVAFSIENGLI